MSNPAPTKISIPDALVAAGKHIMGTSHRQAPVKNLLGSVRDQLSQLFSLPHDWEVVFGNGGASMFWDAATFGLINKRSEHLVFGEFSSKFADAARKAPHLQEPVVVDAPPGTIAEVDPADVDTYCFTHNETSTGATMPLVRPTTPQDALVVVDATSAAGGIAWSTKEVDVYYFSPQKGFGSEVERGLHCVHLAQWNESIQLPQPNVGVLLRSTWLLHLKTPVQTRHTTHLQFPLSSC
jgi:phosphoserine aminotransferase